MNPDKRVWQLCIDSLKDELDEHRRLEFEQYITDDDNRRFYENLRRHWLYIRNSASDYEPDTEVLWQHLQERIAASADTVEAAASPRKNGKRILRSFPAVWRTVALVVVCVGLTWLLAGIGRNHDKPVLEQSFCALDGKAQLRLTDSTSVWLHGGSTLCYDTRFGNKTRDVKLSGEGFFDVAKDPGHPFTVEVSGLKVKALGTRFNIRTLPASGDVLVSLIEGSVALDTDKGEQRIMNPGEIARFDPATRRLDISSGNVALESCWTGGKLSFNSNTIGEVCMYMARWYDIDINVAPAIEHNYAYTFTITNESIEEILHIMSRINPIAYTYPKNRSISITEIE